jgi:hypothetical protein
MRLTVSGLWGMHSRPEHQKTFEAKNRGNTKDQNSVTCPRQSKFARFADGLSSLQLVEQLVVLRWQSVDRLDLDVFEEDFGCLRLKLDAAFG